MKSTRIIFYFLVFLYHSIFAQYDANWPSDSLMLKFDTQGLVSISNSYASQMSTESSISDLQGNLQYYIAYDRNLGNNGHIYFNDNQPILNGTDIRYSRMLNSTLFLPYGGTPYIGLITPQTNSPGSETFYWYNEIDTNINEVIEKNIRLSPEGVPMKMGVAPIRHANGRDWWVIMHNLLGRNYYIWHCSPDSIRLDSVYFIGAYVGLDNSLVGNGRGGGILAHPKGHKAFHFTGEGLIEELDFNRCTGRLSLNRTIAAQVMDNSRVQYYGCLSPSGNILYISNTNFRDLNTSIEQYDLSHPDPLSTRYLVFHKASSQARAYGIQTAPDGRVYFIANKHSVTEVVDFLHLQVIHQPDVHGPGCQYQVNGLYLQGHELSTSNLPYFSNYYLGVQRDSECDSLGLSVAEALSPQAFTLYPNPAGHRARLRKETGAFAATVSVYDAQGSIIDYLQFPLHQDALELNTTAYPKGMYYLHIHSELGHSTSLKLIRE
jgi:hypothetical protein